MRMRGRVYVLCSQCGDYIKVGFSKNPQRRTWAVKDPNGKKAKLFAVTPWMPKLTAYALERAIHHALADRREKDHREWFRRPMLHQVEYFLPLFRWPEADRRRDPNTTKADIARRFGVTWVTVNRWETSPTMKLGPKAKPNAE